MLETLSEELKLTRVFEDQMRKFAKIIVNDSSLQAKLTNAVDEGISRDGFKELYVAMATDQNLSFTTSDLEIAMQEQKQGRDKVLPTVVQKLITIL